MSFRKGRSLGGLDGVAGVRGQGSPPNPAVLPYLASHTADKKTTRLIYIEDI